MLKAKYYISDFRGGKRAASLSKLTDNESQSMQNFMHTDGNLQSMLGRTVYNTTEILGTTPILNHTRFYRTGQAVNGTSSTPHKGWTVAKCGGALWVNVGEVTTAGNSANATAPADFRPILDRLWSNGLSEAFTPASNRLYFASVIDEVSRWEGEFYCVGSARASSTTPTHMLGVGTRWRTAVNTYGSLHPGDQVYFKCNTAGANWSLQSGRWVKAVTGQGTIILNRAAPTMATAAGPFKYMLANVGNVIVPRTATAPSVSATAGTALSAGNYRYKFTWYKSSVGQETNPSSASVATAATGSKKAFIVSGWPTNTDTDDRHKQVDQMSIYRTEAGGAVYKFVATISRGVTTGTFPTQYVDTVPDASLGANAPSDHDTIPANVRNFKEFNNRLYAWGDTDHPERLYFSSLNQPDYWPLYQFGINDPTLVDTTLGGYVVISYPGDPIVACVTEGGAYGNTGNTGSGLVALTKSRCYRWYGMDWTDFIRVEGPGVGCVSAKSAVNAGGVCIWVSRDGPVLLEPGAGYVKPIYKKLWPTLLEHFSKSIRQDDPGTDYSGKISAAWWGEYYLLSYVGTGTSINNSGLIYHIPTDTWMEMNNTSLTTTLAANDFTTWYGPGDYGQLYYSDPVRGYLWRLFTTTTSGGIERTYWPASTSVSGTTGVHALWRSKLYDFGNPLNVKHLTRMVLAWKCPKVAQSATLDIYTQGAMGTSKKTSSITIPAYTTANDDLGVHYSDIVPDLHARAFNFKLSGTFTVPLVLEWIELTYDDEGPAIGRTIG